MGVRFQSPTTINGQLEKSAKPLFKDSRNRLCDHGEGYKPNQK